VTAGEVRDTVSRYTDKLVPWAVIALITGGIALIRSDVKTEEGLQKLAEQITEIQRQNVAQWKSMDEESLDAEIATIQEWMRLLEPLILTHTQHP